MQTIKELLAKQRQYFQTGKTKDAAHRMEALQKLKSGIKGREKALMEALRVDLNKSEFEAYTSEIGFVLSEIGFAIKHLRSWMKPARVRTPLTHIGSKSYIYSEPYGVTLIISPWNYPFQLAVAPLIGSIAAGNCAIVKPSELTPKTSQVLAGLITDLFPEEYIAVVEGGAETSQALLNENLDYIFFTGSVPVGRVVMEAASKHLTPVTLELGGKSPCIVHQDANLKLAAKRIAWGKFSNAGQTCIAPDYLYVHEEIKEEFLEALKAVTAELYGQNALSNKNYTRIVSERHFDRLISYLNNGDLFMGGNVNRETLTIEPTVLTNITWQDAIMQDEIFGPILPVLSYDNLSQVMDVIHDHEKPLALYLFTENRDVEEKVLGSVSFGGGCVNDTVYHFVSPYLPFGGVGSSGIGSYHGKGNFDTFSHHKSVLKQTTLFDIPFRYPNVKNGLKRIKMFLR